jgi:N-acetylgalactosamine-6-sulfatase
MKQTLLFALLLVSPGALLGAEATKLDRKPNIIFILADDSGFADFGCYGHPYARTPNIDRLAAEGTCFRQFYATGVTCCPSRSGLMTSQWPASFATYPANGGFGKQVTITELLNKAGYATGHFGKWHIGPVEKPGTYGIDDINTAEPGAKKNNTRGRDAPIYDEAIKFVEKNKDHPFYMNVWSHVSHHKVDPPRRYVDLFKDVVVNSTKFAEPMQEKFAACKALGGDLSEHMRSYLADIFTMDEDIGRLLKRLDELGLREDTIVVFSSDQGPSGIRTEADDPQKDIRLNAMGYTGVHRGGKHGMFEGGIRVPFVVRWPGHVPAKRVDEKSVLSGADWLPTLCAIAGVKINANDFDGEDVSAAWLGNKAHVRVTPLLWKTSSPGSPSVIREAQWKLIHPTRKNGGELELYDIINDPGEKKNVAAQHPHVVKKLSVKVDDWVRTLPKVYLKNKDNEK